MDGKQNERPEKAFGPKHFPESVRASMLICGIFLYIMPFFNLPWLHIPSQHSVCFSFGLTIIFGATNGKPTYVVGAPVAAPPPFRPLVRGLIFLLACTVFVMSLVRDARFDVSDDSIMFYLFCTSLVGLAYTGRFLFELPVGHPPLAGFGTT